MNAMVDRPKAVVAGALGTVAVLVLLGVGFLAGRAGAGDDSTGGGPGVGGDGVPAGPAGMNDGVPVGFAHSEDGVLGAALAWFPSLVSSPVDERPEGIEAVLADGVDLPLDDASDRFSSVRLQFTPIAAKVEMDGDDRATVTLLGPMLRGDLGQELTGDVLSLPLTLEWDGGAADWRIAALPTGSPLDYEVGDQLDAGDVEGFRAIRPAGAVEGPPIVEEVPGE